MRDQLQEPISGAPRALHRIRLYLRNFYAAASPILREKTSAENPKDLKAYLNLNAREPTDLLSKRLNDYIRGKTAELDAAKIAMSRTESRVLKGLTLISVLALAFAGVITLLLGRLLSEKRARDKERDQLLQREQKISQARKETLEVVSHDLKNPLSTLKMGLDFIEESISDAQAKPADLKDDLEIAQRAVKSMEYLIKDLLDHAKIESGHLSLERVPVNVNSLLAEVVTRFGPLAKSKDVELNVRPISNFSAGLNVHCDQERIAQVFSNLIGNAVKFSKPGSHIEVRVQIKDDQALFSVVDEGPGIPADQVPYIFDRFWQVRETASKGTGLGLAIAKGILEAHDGDIWVESTLGQGSKFTFRLPLAIETLKLSGEPHGHFINQ